MRGHADSDRCEKQTLFGTQGLLTDKKNNIHFFVVAFDDHVSNVPVIGLAYTSKKSVDYV